MMTEIDKFMSMTSAGRNAVLRESRRTMSPKPEFHLESKPCRMCGATMLYDEGEPWDGPTWACTGCGHSENAAKTTNQRVAKLRADRDALGLRRLELYVHPEDWPAIKALSEKLRRKRIKASR